MKFFDLESRNYDMSLSTKSQASKTIPGVLLVSKAAKPKRVFSCLQLTYRLSIRMGEGFLDEKQHKHLEPEEPLAKTQITPHLNCHHPHPEQRTVQDPEEEKMSRHSQKKSAEITFLKI